MPHYENTCHHFRYALMCLLKTFGNHQHLISPNLLVAEESWKTDNPIYGCYYYICGAYKVSFPPSVSDAIINRTQMPQAVVIAPLFL